MKSLFKVTLLATTMAFALNATQVMAADAAKSTETSAPSTGKFNSDNEQTSYAVGASLGNYLNNSLKEQEQLGITLDKTQLFAGIEDAFANKSKLNDADIQKTLQSFEVRVKNAAQAKMAQDAKLSEQEGDKYRKTFAAEKGVKKTASGLLYLVKKEGTGKAPQDSDTVVVNYKGTLVNGTVFDSSYTRGEPLSFRLDGVIPGWTEGLKHIRKGGEIKLVIPPNLAYGDSGVPGIPGGSTLVFDVQLLDVKPASKTNDDTKKSAETPSSSKAK